MLNAYYLDLREKHQPRTVEPPRVLAVVVGALVAAAMSDLPVTPG